VGGPNRGFDCDICRRKQEKDPTWPYKCEVNCPKPDYQDDDIEALAIIELYGGIIYDGESINPDGISYAMKLHGVSPEYQSITAVKIINFFETIRSDHIKKMKDRAKRRRK
jgi:hypothetical protein